MTGYQEIITDPSYCKQIVTLTYPHIGNTGVNLDDVESGRINKIHAAGLIIRDLSLTDSNWRKDSDTTRVSKRTRCGSNIRGGLPAN